MNQEVGNAARFIRDQIVGFTQDGPMLQTLRTRLDESFFAPAKPSADQILKIFHLLAKSELEQIPLTGLQEITSGVNNAVAALVKIKDYNGSQGTPRPPDFAASMTDAWVRLYSQGIPHILYANMLSGQKESETSKIVAELVQMKANVQGDAADIKKILEDARKAAAEVGVSQQAKHFKEVADSHQRMSWLWGVLTAVLVIGGFIFAVFYLPSQLDKVPADLPPSRIAQLIFNKLLAVSLLSFGIAWAARNFSASRHNFITNQHRQTALSTFETIVNGVKDDDAQARNAVLVYAAQAIFMPAATGYSKGILRFNKSVLWLTLPLQLGK